jgi:hypothetical protein
VNNLIREFIIEPIITQNGVRYIIKEDKWRGLYIKVGKQDGKLSEMTTKYSATQYGDVMYIKKVLDYCLGTSYKINDNYM